MENRLGKFVVTLEADFEKLIRRGSLEEDKKILVTKSMVKCVDDVLMTWCRSNNAL